MLTRERPGHYATTPKMQIRLALSMYVHCHKSTPHVLQYICTLVHRITPHMYKTTYMYYSTMYQYIQEQLETTGWE
jgi:hypothetical protein